MVVDVFSRYRSEVKVHNQQCGILVGSCKERSGDAYAEQAPFKDELY